jgi:hypothetical protein
MNDFYDYVKPGFVSVWIGDFRSEDGFDDYLRETFLLEFGVEIPTRAVQEMGVEAEPKNIADLVKGFSRAKTFSSRLIEVAEEKGITNASCMFAVYNFRYDGSQEVPDPKVKFLGAVPFPGFG